FNGTDIEITPWSMVHILNRHYAGKIKDHMKGKSYHGDSELPFFEDPERLKDVLEKMDAHPDARKCRVDYVVFKLNSVIYAVRTKLQERHVAGTKTSYRQLQTFFPIEEVNKLQDLHDNYVE